MSLDHNLSLAPTARQAIEHEVASLTEAGRIHLARALDEAMVHLPSSASLWDLLDDIRARAVHGIPRSRR
jgi:hypothetical protein